MKKHIYRPDMKSVVERAMRCLAYSVRTGTPIGDASDGEAAPPALGNAELVSVVTGALRNYNRRLDPTDGRGDPHRLTLVYGGKAMAMDVFVRRRAIAGEV